MTEAQVSGRSNQPVNSASWWRYVDRVKVCLEIAAILTAGVWAYTRFMIDEAPGLGPRPEMNATLDWWSVTDSECLAEYEVQFKNIGKTPISIGETRISVWYLSHAVAADISSPVEYIDPMGIRQEPVLYSDLNNRLIGTYGPGITETEGFSFVVKNNKGKRILFEIEIWSMEDLKKPIRPKNATWHDFRWDYVCGAQEKEPKTN